MAKWKHYFHDDFKYQPSPGKTLLQDDNSPFDTVDPHQPGHFLYKEGWDATAPANVSGRIKFLVRLFFEKDASQNHGAAKARLARTGAERQDVFIHEARVSKDGKYLEICWGDNVDRADTTFNVKLSDITE